MDNECKARCVGMDCKRRRRMMAKLRGGTAELGVEIGRWHGLRREDRVCKECGNGEVEDTEHFVMRCAYVVKDRKRLENLMSSRVKGWHVLGDNEKVVRIISVLAWFLHVTQRLLFQLLASVLSSHVRF